MTLLALTMLMCSVQASATDLRILKPKSVAVTAAEVSPSAEFTEFRILKESERTDWFVIINNTSNVNMVRNVYEIRAMQTSIAGVTSPAGTPFKLEQDIRSGRAMNLQRQFSPIMDINRITIEAIDTRSNRSIGSEIFSATGRTENSPGGDRGKHSRRREQCRRQSGHHRRGSEQITTHHQGTG